MAPLSGALVRFMASVMVWFASTVNPNVLGVTSSSAVKVTVQFLVQFIVMVMFRYWKTVCSCDLTCSVWFLGVTSVLLYCFAFSDVFGLWLVVESEFGLGVEVLLLWLFAVPVCSSWVDPFPLPANVVDRGAMTPAISRIISIALSLFRLIFAFTAFFTTREYYDARLKVHCETSVPNRRNGATPSTLRPQDTSK